MKFEYETVTIYVFSIRYLTKYLIHILIASKPFSSESKVQIFEKTNLLKIWLHNMELFVE